MTTLINKKPAARIATSLIGRLRHVPLDKLTISALNVRKHGPKDVASLAHSIRAQGLLQPLIARPDGDDFAVIAGSRRLRALQLIARDEKDMPDVPIIPIGSNDDALAIEASLAENIERLPMDELDQYVAFAALIRQGRSEAEIAESFGVTVQTVRRRLALAKLIPDIHRLYRAGEIEGETLRLLTLASKDRQRAYVALLRDPDAQRPPRWQLKAWLLGGSEIDVRRALFDESDYKGEIAGDLFSDLRYFTDAEQFWQLQNQAIALLADDLRAKGWTEVHVIGPDPAFRPHEWQDVRKADGGHAVIAVSANGQVEINRGLLRHDEIKKLSRARTRAADRGGDPTVTGGGSGEGESTVNERAELSGPLANYIDLVRLSAARAGLVKSPKLAMRVLLAQMLGSATHITVNREPMTALSEATAKTVAALSSEQQIEDAETNARQLLDLEKDDPLIGQRYEPERTLRLLAKLMTLPDSEVMTLLALVAANTLALGSGLVDQIGTTLKVEVGKTWQPDDAFFEHVRDREVIDALLADVIGADAARSYTTDTGKAKKHVIKSALAGINRAKVTGWLPKWLRFPAEAYTKRALKAGGRTAA